MKTLTQRLTTFAAAAAFTVSSLAFLPAPADPGENPRQEERAEMRDKKGDKEKDGKKKEDKGERAERKDEKKNITDMTAEGETFETLNTLLADAGLSEALKAQGPFTVFAPTDEAFEKLGEDAVRELSENPTQLRQLLLYHIALDEVTTEDALAMETPRTALGSEVTVRNSGDDIQVNEATIVEANLVASNGVIHAIDTVLMPPPPEQPSADQYERPQPQQPPAGQPAPGQQSPPPAGDPGTY